MNMQMIRKKMVKSVKEGMKQKASQSEIYGRMEAVFIELDASPAVSIINSYHRIFNLEIHYNITSKCHAA